jgi:hypothetical protein
MLNSTLPYTGFALAGLAAPPGILGPRSSKGARRRNPSRPALLRMQTQKIDARPQNQSGPGAERAGTGERAREGARDLLSGGIP